MVDEDTANKEENKETHTTDPSQLEDYAMEDEELSFADENEFVEIGTLTLKPFV